MPATGALLARVAICGSCGTSSALRPKSPPPSGHCAPDAAASLSEAVACSALRREFMTPWLSASVYPIGSSAASVVLAPPPTLPAPKLFMRPPACTNARRLRGATALLSALPTPCTELPPCERRAGENDDIMDERMCGPPARASAPAPTPACATARASPRWRLRRSSSARGAAKAPALAFARPAASTRAPAVELTYVAVAATTSAMPRRTATIAAANRRELPLPPPPTLDADDEREMVVVAHGWRPTPTRGSADADASRGAPDACGDAFGAPFASAAEGASSPV